MKTEKFILLALLAIGLSVSGVAYGQTHGMAPQKGIVNTPLNVGDPVVITFYLQNNDGSHDTLTVSELHDVLHSLPYGDIVSADILKTLNWTFRDNGNGIAHWNDDVTKDFIVMPYLSEAFTKRDLSLAPEDDPNLWTFEAPAQQDGGNPAYPGGPYQVTVEDALNQQISDTVSITFQDLCTSGAGDCPDGDQHNTGNADASVEPPPPCIEITKVPDPNFSKVGDTVTYTYCIHNCGVLTLQITGITDTKVDDTDLGAALLAALPTLILDPNDDAPGGTDEVCFDVDYTVLAADDTGPGATLVNIVTVNAQDTEFGQTVDANDTATVPLVHPCIEITKECDPNEIEPGAAVTYKYTVHNCGDVALENIVLTDDQLGVIPAPTSLDPDGSFEVGVLQNVYESVTNLATVEATVITLGNPVDANDTCTVTVGTPCIHIEKATNGEDADDPNGPTITVGGTVTWTYEVTNCSDPNNPVPLSNIVVTDDNGTPGDTGDDFHPTAVDVSPADGFNDGDTNTDNILDVGETWLYEASGTAQAGQYANIACVVGTPPAGPDVNDCDPSHYYGEEPGGEGCTPGFWKNNAVNWDANAWDCYSPETKFSAVFGVTITINVQVKGGKNGTITDPTLLQALDANGGGINALARAAVAALLNACSECVNYVTNNPQDIIDAVQSVIGDDKEVKNLAGELDFFNNAGCPINQKGECSHPV